MYNTLRKKNEHQPKMHMDGESDTYTVQQYVAISIIGRCIFFFIMPRCFRQDQLWVTVEALWVIEGVKLPVAGGYKYSKGSDWTWTQEWLCWYMSATIVNYRPFLLSEKMPHINKPTSAWLQYKSDLGSCMGAWHWDRLAECLSVSRTLTWLGLQQTKNCWDSVIVSSCC